MADVRALLRQQRAARRIEHPSAAYTEAGKLLCTLCREQIKAESLWDSHVQSQNHTRRLQSADKANGQAHGDPAGTSQKRKLDDEGGDVDMEDGLRRKRSKGDILDFGGADAIGKDTSGKDAALTPPTLARRTSTTPSQGVELQIASRPATPARRTTSSSSTPGGASSVPSQVAGPTTSLPSRQANNLAHAGQPNSLAAQVDEAEWEAFQADIAAISAPYDQDAVISAPAMTAEESAAAAAAAAEKAEGTRKPQVDVDIEDEREEATRAMEDEFDEMQGLEERVKRLKEKREALRKQSEVQGRDLLETPPLVPGTENAEEGTAVAGGDAKSDDEEDDDDADDDWDGFRFRTS